MITEITLGGLIYHLVSVEPAIPDVMVAKNLIIKSGQHNILLGENSVRKPIFGYGYDVPIVSHVTGSINFKIGAYLQDEKHFNDIGVTVPFHNFMPVMGFEFNLPMSDSVALTTTITPLMTFTGVTLRF